MISNNQLVRNSYKIAWLRMLPRPDPVVIVDPIPQFDLYVDSVNGDDNRDGQHEQYPIQTIAKLQTLLVGTGIRVGLARGSHWREQLNLPFNNISVGAYGTGALPILDCSDIAPNNLFTKTAGRTNIYETTVTPAWYGLGQDGFNCWENGVVLPQSATLAALDAAPGHCMPSGSAGAITLYVHASDSSNVTANHKVYEYTQRLMGLYYRAYSSCRISNIHTRRNLYSGGSLVGGPNTTITGCTFSDGNAHNVLIESGSLINCLVSESYIASGSNAMLVFNQNNCNGEACLVSGCTFESVNTTTLPLQAIYGHHNVAGDYGIASVDSCIFRGNIKLCISFAFMAALNVTNCDSTGITASGPTFVKPNHLGASYTISNNTGITLDGQYAGIEAALPITMSGNTVVVGATGSAAIFSVQAGVTLTLDNNIFSLALGAGVNRIVVWFTQAGNSISSHGNQYKLGAGHYAYFCPAGITSFVSNSNEFALNGNNRWAGGITYNGLAAWQAATGFDGASTES